MFKIELNKVTGLIILCLFIFIIPLLILNNTSVDNNLNIEDAPPTNNINLNVETAPPTNIFMLNSTSRSLPRASNDWPMFRRDLAHSGVSSSSVPNNNTVLWSNTTGNGDSYGSPVIADGKVIIGAQDGNLYCFDLNTGQRLWKTFLSTSYSSICSTPAVANDHIVIASAGDKKIYRLRISDGGINWSISVGGTYPHYGGSSPAINNGRIYVGAFNYKIFCLNETTGSTIWTYKTGSGPVRDYGVQSSPAVANGRVFIGACDTYLYCINESQPSATAQHYWRISLGDAIFASPSVANGRVYCGSGYYTYSEGTGSHKMFCIDELNGTIIWSYQTGSDVLSSPAIVDGKAYFTSTDGKLYCVDAIGSGGSTSLYWNQTVGESWSSPAVADGKVVVGSKNDWIYCFNSTTGTLLWKYNTGGDIDNSPPIADGKVIVASKGWPAKIYCFGTSDTTPPTVISTFPSNNAINVPVTANISVIFSEAMTASTISTSTFILKDSAQNTVAGTVIYNAATYTAIFDPTNNLKLGEKYNATILSTVEDTSGLSLDGNYNGTVEGSPLDDYSWNFTTSSNVSLNTTICIKPETLNLDSKGKFTAFIELPTGYDVADIDLSTVICEGAPAIRGNIENDTIVVKFNRQDLVGVKTGEEVTFTVTGNLYDGTLISGSDTIRAVI